MENNFETEVLEGQNSVIENVTESEPVNSSVIEPEANIETASVEAEKVQTPEEEGTPISTEEAEDEEADDSSDDESDDAGSSTNGQQRKKRGLNLTQIHTRSKLLKVGYKFGLLKINRAVNTRALDLKCKSIKHIGGVISPCLVVTARQCLDAGLEIILKDDYKTAVTLNTPDIDKILIIIDGQHRDAAVDKLNSRLKAGQKPYENYYYFPLIGDADIVSMLREANVATAVWKGGDYLTKLLSVAANVDGLDTSLLEWVQNRFETCGDTASWLWATLDPSRVYSKSMLDKASDTTKHFDLLEKIADTTNFTLGKLVYESAVKSLGSELVKLKVVPGWVISMIKKNNKVAACMTVSDLSTFFDSVTPEQAKMMKEFKKDGTLTKDAQIEAKLNDLYEDYLKKLTPGSTSDTITQE